MPQGADELSYAVIIIAFNQETTISEAIKSVLAQTAFDRISEIIVVDDCSTDSTVKIATKYANLNEKIRVIRHKVNSGGCAQPRNTGIRATNSTHICLLDGDDIWKPEKLSIEDIILRNHPNIGLLYSDYTSIKEHTNKRHEFRVRRYFAEEKDQLKRFFVHGGPVIPSSATINRTALRNSGLFDPKTKFNEDSDLWNRLAIASKLHHTRRNLVVKKEWHGSLGSNKYRKENILAKNEITDKMISQYPALQIARSKRESLIRRQLATCKIAQGQNSSGRQLLWESIKLDKANTKAIILLILSHLSLARLAQNTNTQNLTNHSREYSR